MNNLTMENNMIQWLNEEDLNDSYINKGNFYDAVKLYVEICVSRHKRFVDKYVLEKYYNRPIRVKVRT
jgi:hypothetical protein